KNVFASKLRNIINSKIKIGIWTGRSDNKVQITALLNSKSVPYRIIFPIAKAGTIFVYFICSRASALIAGILYIDQFTNRNGADTILLGFILQANFSLRRTANINKTTIEKSCSNKTKPNYFTNIFQCR